MNLDDSTKVAQEIEERNRKKKIVITSILLCIVLMAAMGVVIFFITYNDSRTLKIFVNGSQKSIASTLFKESNGVKYVNVNDFVKLINVSYTKGKYQAYDEDENSCYLTSLHEVVSITGGEQTYSKFLVDESDSQGKPARVQAEQKAFGKLLTIASAQGTEEVHDLKYPILASKNGLYVSMDDLPIMFNLRITSENEYRIRFTTMSSLFASAQKSATKAGCTVISYEYENMRALLDNLIVAGESTSKMGLLSTKNQERIISCIYDRFIYLQNAKEFFVYANKSCALFSEDGTQIIKPSEFDDISVLDQGKAVSDRLYMVKKNNKVGVLNREGQVIIHPEYDYIGLQAEDFGRESSGKSLLNEVTNTKVLFDSVIPVKLNGKYGLFGLDGSELAPIQYDGLGFSYSSGITKNPPANGQSGVLIIPESLGIQGIVMRRNDGYGIFDAAKGKLIIPTNNSEIYKLLKGGVTTYYMVFDDQVMDLEKYIKDNKLVSVKEQTLTQESQAGGTVYDQPVNLTGNTTSSSQTQTTDTINSNTSTSESYIQYTPTEVTNSSGESYVPVETVPLF